MPMATMENSHHTLAAVPMAAASSTTTMLSFSTSLTDGGNSSKTMLPKFCENCRCGVQATRENSSPDTTASTKTGWSDMQTTVREFDTEKVKASKEDIDALLLFAGLYSAVLAAFSVFSIGFLLPDRGAETVVLLRELVSQGAASAGQAVRRTRRLPPAVTDDSDFVAPTWAVRVNILWFASLVISMATASYAIMVKQWLTEYLAMEYASPQERLRARQYRYPAMKSWHVFSIAALLPLLLQLSLGLFFIGLCYFTAAFNRQLGLTTLPLVSGWIFFFGMAIISPLLSPRCPFKVTLLKHTMKTGREHFPFLPTLAFSLVYLFRALYRRILGHGSAQPSGGDAADSSRWLPSKEEVAAAKEEEEHNINAHRHQDDSEILVSVDAILPGNGLLPTILGAFRQQDPHKPDDVIDFVLKLIAHRVAATAEDVVNTYGHLPLDLLSNQDWTELSSLVVNTITTHHLEVSPSTEAPTWLVKALALVLSPSGHELPPRRHATVYRCVLEEHDPNHAILQNVVSPAVTRSGADITTTMELIFTLIGLALSNRGHPIPAAHEPKLLDLDVLQDRTTYQPLSNIMEAAMKALKQHDKIRTARRAQELTFINNLPYGSAPTTEDISVANAILILFSGSSRAVPRDVRDFMCGYEIGSRPLSVILDALSTAMLAPNNTENGSAALSAAFGHPSYRVRAVLRFLSLYFKPGGLSLPLESMPTLQHITYGVRQKLLQEVATAVTAGPIDDDTSSWSHDAAMLLASAPQSSMSNDMQKALLSCVSNTAVMRKLLHAMANSTMQKVSYDSLDLVSIIRAATQFLTKVGLYSQKPRISPVLDLHTLPAEAFTELTRKVAQGLAPLAVQRPKQGSWACYALTILLARSDQNLPELALDVLQRYALSPPELKLLIDTLSPFPGDQDLFPLFAGPFDEISLDYEQPVSDAAQTLHNLLWIITRFVQVLPVRDPGGRSPQPMEQLQAAWGTLMNKAGEILAVAPAGTRWYSDADHSPPTPLNQLTSFKKRAAVLLLTPSQLDLPPTVTRTLQSWLSQPSFVLKATLEPLLSDSVAPADALWSVVAALRYLLGDSGKVVPREVFTTILQFPDSLPDDKWTTITDIVAEIIRGKIKSHTNLQPTLPEWLVDAVILLLSRPTHEVSRDAAACLELLFGHTPRIVNLVWKRTSASAFVPLSRRLASICTNGLTLKACLDLYACYLAPEDKLNSQSDPSSRSVSSSQPDPNTQPDLAKTAARRSLTEILRMQNPRKPEVLKDLWEFLEKCVPQLNIPSPQWRDVSAEVIGVLMLLSRCVFEMDASGGLLKLFRSMWANEGSFGIFWLLATLHPKDRLQDPGILDTCRNLLRAADLKECLEQSRARLSVLIDKMDDTEFQDNFGALDALRLCELYVDVHQVVPGERLTHDVKSLWRDIWDLLAKLVQAYHAEQGWTRPPRRMLADAGEGWTMSNPSQDTSQTSPETLYSEDQDLARSCLGMMQSDTEAPGDLILALECFVPPDMQS